MMHHPNMHHQPMPGHPAQHMGGHQTMPGHHQMPPHQLHRESRHVTLTRVPLGPSQAAGGMSAPGQAMGGMSAMGVPPHHGPQRPPHAMRAMPPHPGGHHSVPTQQMKPLRRPYVTSAYGPGSNIVPGPFPQHRHHHHIQPTQSGQLAPMQHNRLCGPTSPSIFSALPKLGSDFVSSAVVTNTCSTNVPEASANVSANAGVITNANASTTVISTSAADTSGGTTASGDGEAARPTSVQANSKEKTPMCLVNELARYNKIKHQYRLTSETGPAHKKVFTVTLLLGETEEYTAEGSSIKRAQHAAASTALSATAYPPPPPRALSQHPTAHPHHRHSVMPTVELNALAMKLCQPAVYTSIPAVASSHAGPVAGITAGRSYRGAYLPPVYNPRLVPTGTALIYRVRVAVGGSGWLGEGPTPQAARHDAAARALRDLRPPPDPRAHQPPNALAPAETTQPTELDNSEADLLNSEVKSPVSLVHELALKRNLSVQFTVKSERGPPHMRVFVTLCTVGELETEGEGNGKKVSKRRAAEVMLEEMRRRWPAAVLRTRPVTDPRRRTHPAKKKPRNLVKDVVENGTSGGGGCGSGAGNGTSALNGSSENPISRLAVARHAARARSPQYRVVEERGAARRREFLVQCDAPPHSATGLGPNKKIAKRRAAQNVLLSMEQSVPSTNKSASPTDTNTEANSVRANDSNKLNFTEETQKENVNDGGEVRQPVPGVLLMDYHQRTHPVQHNGVSETNTSGGSTPGAKDQLIYLSHILGFTVQFSDFPKRNHGEYLSLVSLSTEPPVMCHGGGPSTAHSHEQCSRAALSALAKMGLDATGTPEPCALGQPLASAGIQNNSATSGPASAISNGVAE